MKYMLFILVAAFMFACEQKQPQLTVTNTSDYHLVEKPVLIQRAQIEEQTGKLSESDVVLLSADGGRTYIASQLDDLDGDGIWDELFTMVDLYAGESKTYSLITMKKEEAPEFRVRTNIHFADKNDREKLFLAAERLKNADTQTTQKFFQYEGPGWENDIVGFRNYFDARNGMDIWGKVTPDMILPGVGLAGGPSYHEMQPWGMDVLKVANSLGAGAIALETSAGLYRVGPDGKGTYRLVAEGPLRSTFDLRFEDIPLDGKMVTLNHRICIIAGKPWYKSVVTVNGAADMKFVTGIVNLDTDSVYSNSGNGYAYMYTHDNQAFDGEKLGMAIILPYNSIDVYTAPETGEGITQTYYTSLEISEKPNVYFFMAGWEKQDARWADKDSFEEGVNEQGRLIAAKIDISLSK
jgi:hypothetical protein